MASELALPITPSVPAAGLVAEQAPARTKHNFLALTGMRFFAAFAVVLYHFAGTVAQPLGGPVLQIVNSGFIAVSFFYVLSGFVLSYSYVDALGSVRGTRRSFWVARLARIYPAYLFAFLLAAPTNIAWSLRVNHLGSALAKLFVGAVSVLAMQQAWTPWSAWYWNYPAWSVSVEAFFYLCFPFLAVYLVRFSRRSAFFGMSLCWLLSLLPPVLLLVFHGAPTSVADRAANAVEFTPLLRLPEFLMGMLLGRLWTLGFRFSPVAARWAAPLSMAALATVVAVSSLVPRPLLAVGLLAPLFCLLILSLAEGYGPVADLLSWKPLVVLGEASYGIYILQIPVSYVLRTPPPSQSWTGLSLYLSALLAVALFSWRFIERPVGSWIKARLA